MTPHSRLLALSRREFLRRSSIGIGALALSSLLSRELTAGPASGVLSGRLHHRARAKNVIFLHMVGAPSHVDLFDPKPALAQWSGRPLPDSFTKEQQFAFIPKDAKVMPSPYTFRRVTDGGIEVSDRLPHLAKVADDLCVIRSMQTPEINHGAAELFLHSGFGRLGRPSFGAWASYGLGTENDNLPAYVVLNSGLPVSGSGSWSSGYLPPEHQGVQFREGADPIFFLQNPAGVKPGDRHDVVQAVSELNALQHRQAHDPQITARISQYELAFRMQSSVPELTDLSTESDATLGLYGAKRDQPSYARNCLLARRLIERGVRFVQVHLPGWDHHADIYGGMPNKCAQSDRPSAALITDLKQRGLLDDTLVIWGGEFGRTPMVQDVAADGKRTKPGRDHHKEAFTIWMAGGGVKGGLSYGVTDEFGFGVVKNPVHVHDLHATCLHLLGIEHTQLTYRYQGRDFRLTDVHGDVVKDIFT